MNMVFPTVAASGLFCLLSISLGVLLRPELRMHLASRALSLTAIADAMTVSLLMAQFAGAEYALYPTDTLSHYGVRNVMPERNLSV